MSDFSELIAALATGRIAIWAGACVFALLVLLVIFQKVELEVGDFEQPWSRLTKPPVRAPRPPWIVVAFMKGNQLDYMREFYFDQGQQWAMRGRCPHCHQRLSDG